MCQSSSATNFIEKVQFQVLVDIPLDPSKFIIEWSMEIVYCHSISSLENIKGWLTEKYYTGVFSNDVLTEIIYTITHFTYSFKNIKV